MIQVKIVKWKKSVKYLVWIGIICFITGMTLVIFDCRIGVVLMIPTVVAFIFVKFMRKSISIGNISFNTDTFTVELGGLKKDFNYDIIDKLNFSNYNGQQYFSFKDIYPFYDGLNNYIWIENGVGIEKIEIKIDSEQKYKALERHFKLIQGDFKRLKWKIKPL